MKYLIFDKEDRKYNIIDQDKFDVVMHRLISASFSYTDLSETRDIILYELSQNKK